MSILYLIVGLIKGSASMVMYFLIKIIGNKSGVIVSRTCLTSWKSLNFVIRLHNYVWDIIYSPGPVSNEVKGLQDCRHCKQAPERTYMTN